MIEVIHGRAFRGVLLALLLGLPALAHGAIWINEIHYDNVGADANEFIEVVVGPDISDPLTNINVHLYNGANGDVYATYNMGTFFTGETVNAHTFYYTPITGVQNGAPDGMALAIGGILVAGQNLSYEGTYTPDQGPANGVLTTDILVSEPNGPNLASESLYLYGTGTTYAAFFWTGPLAATPGLLNTGQSIPAAVPEPGTAALLLLGASVLYLRRRRNQV